jgi:hypothetical protein
MMMVWILTIYQIVDISHVSIISIEWQLNFGIDRLFKKMLNPSLQTELLVRTDLNFCTTIYGHNKPD